MRDKAEMRGFTGMCSPPFPSTNGVCFCKGVRGKAVGGVYQPGRKVGGNTPGGCCLSGFCEGKDVVMRGISLVQGTGGGADQI